MRKETKKRLILMAALAGTTGLAMLIGLWLLPWLSRERETPVARYQIVNRFPHDPSAFTQGLVFHDGYLYESTGIRGESTLRKVQLETGKVLERVTLAPSLFGEGLALQGENLIQITWQAGRGFIYDRQTLRKKGEFAYKGEGWGLAHTSEALIMSSGSSSLRFLDPATWEVTRKTTVFDGNRPVDRLNELEWVKGRLYANVWKTDRIAKIDIRTGQVTGWLDLSGLLDKASRARHEVDVLNGIAYDAANNRLFVTGKFWPWVYEIREID